MATIYGAIDSIKWLSEPNNGGIRAVAEVKFSVPLYDASADNGQLGGGGYIRGASTTNTLVAILQNTRRDGKTVTLRFGMSGEEGFDGTTAIYADTWAVSGSNMTFELADAGGTEQDCTVDDGNVTALIAVDLS
jgi:hypothetical protein